MSAREKIERELRGLCGKDCDLCCAEVVDAYRDALEFALSCLPAPRPKPKAKKAAKR